METQGLLAEAPWPLNVHSQIFRISLQISGPCYIRGVEVLRGATLSQRKPEEKCCWHGVLGLFMSIFPPRDR